MADRTTFAILGGGVFTRDVYLPLFRECAHKWRLAAVWTRSATTADGLEGPLDRWPGGDPPPCVVCGEEGLQELLADESITAVVVCLPAQAAPEVTRRCLEAGKDVLQEKPLAETVAACKAALEAYASAPAPLPTWALAENWRSEGVVMRAAELAPTLGPLLKMDLLVELPIPGSKYANSHWRHALPGGFIADCAIHYVAALRYVAAAAGWGDVCKAVAHGQLLDPSLRPFDTLIGHLQFQSGGRAAVSICFAAPVLRFQLAAVGAKGTLEVHRGGPAPRDTPWELFVKGPLPEARDARREGFGFSGMESEIDAMVAVAAARRVGEPPPEHVAARVAPVEGARDVAAVAALLRSAELGGEAVEVERIQM